MQAIKFLSSDPDVQQMMKSFDIPSGNLPEDWFRAGLIKTESRHTTYLVVANGKLAGAHSTTFWIFDTEDGRKYDVLLKVYADTLTLKGRDASGFPIVKTVTLGASTSYQTYRLISGKYMPLNPKN